MGVKVKLVLFVILALSASVLGQDSIVNENESIVSDKARREDDEIPESDVTVTKDNGPPVELISNETLEVKIGKYQAFDDTLVGDAQTNPEAVELEAQNERQMIAPPGTTSITNTEYGELTKYI